MTGRHLVAASESAPSEADPSHDCPEGAVSEADLIEVGPESSWLVTGLVLLGVALAIFLIGWLA